MLTSHARRAAKGLLVLFFVGALATTLATPRLAHAASPACDAAYEQVQTDRSAGRYASARKALVHCARPECGPEPGSPGSIERDCAAWLEEDLLKTPTVVLGARDQNGNDLLDVRVTMDGVPIPLPLDGKPIEVDAGERTFVFERHGTTEQRKVIARYGERGVPLVVTLFSSRAPKPRRASQGTESVWTTWRVAGIAAAGVGLVGLGVGTGFAVKAESANAEAGCDATDTCEFPERRRDAQRAGGVATVGFVAGGALVVTGVVLALLSPRTSGVAATPVLRLTPLMASGGAGVALGGGF